MDVQLDGEASDDGLPDGTLITTWTDTGQGTVSYTPDQNDLDAVATFTEVGEYVLQLQADDGAEQNTDTMNMALSTFPAYRSEQPRRARELLISFVVTGISHSSSMCGCMRRTRHTIH